MSESIKKVEHADFVGLLKLQDVDQQNQTQFTDLDLFIGKNRSGPKDRKVTLRSDFSRFLIKDNVKSAGRSFEKSFIEGTNDVYI